jgi:peptidoglycan/xylan/chitin deacetylase (PgdA/CDA1 family)
MLTGCGNKKEIKLLSDKILELEKNKEELTLKASDLENTNKKLNSEIVDLKKSSDFLTSEVEQLNNSNKELETAKQTLKDSNDKLQKEITELKKKLKAYEENKPTPPNPTPPSTSSKTAYLTFDDGPSDNTIKILDILKQNNIKATFFVNGRPEKKEIYKRIVNEGHAIGNHTYSHDYSAIYQTIEGFYKDKEKLDNFLFDTTGVKPKILRFPGGSNNHSSYKYGGVDFMDKLTKNARQAGIKYFDWNVSSEDAAVVTQDESVIISKVLTGAKNKKQAIILMHDSKPKTTTASALPKIINGLKEQGFKFAALSPEVAPVQFK